MGLSSTAEVCQSAGLKKKERDILLMKEVNHFKWVLYLDLYKATGQTRTDRQEL
jgi:hypothetical protein